MAKKDEKYFNSINKNTPFIQQFQNLTMKISREHSVMFLNSAPRHTLYGEYLQDLKDGQLFATHSPIYLKPENRVEELLLTSPRATVY